MAIRNFFFLLLPYGLAVRLINHLTGTSKDPHITNGTHPWIHHYQVWVASSENQPFYSVCTHSGRVYGFLF